jgi:DNA repair photolyase
MRIIDVKSIIQPNNNFNLYRGCTHGCIYCDSRSVCYEVGEFENIAVKKDALVLMEQELSRRRQRVMLTTGSMSDPYVHLEKELRLTEGALKLIETYRFGISTLTKSDLITRDLALYQAIDKAYRAVVCLTITTWDDDLARVLEPQAALPSKRFQVLKTFSDAQITTGIWMTPILPFLEDTDENILGIVKRAAAAGVKFIVGFGIGTTMREGSRDYFYQQLDRHFPGLRAKYEWTYGKKYICPSPRQKELQTLFETACNAHGIVTKHDEMSRFYLRRDQAEQLSLF